MLKSLTNAQVLILLTSVETSWMCISQTQKASTSFATISIRINPLRCIKAFEDEEAKRITEKLQFHYTPKHGSWLNIAKIELSVLSRQCLCRRLPDQETLKREFRHGKTGEINNLPLSAGGLPLTMPGSNSNDSILQQMVDIVLEPSKNFQPVPNPIHGAPTVRWLVDNYRSVVLETFHVMRGVASSRRCMDIRRCRTPQ